MVTDRPKPSVVVPTRSISSLVARSPEGPANRSSSADHDPKVLRQTRLETADAAMAASGTVSLERRRMAADGIAYDIPADAWLMRRAALVTR